MTVLLKACEVSKIYRMGESEVHALDCVSVEIKQGEMIAIQGTSGSGKSTLLNLLGALDRPTSGEIRFDGRSLQPFGKKEMADYRRRSIGMIFQNFNLVPTMTASDNVQLALAFGGVRGAKRSTRAAELLARVGLASRLGHRPSELSGGEQQRVAIARALANSPRVLLADEPTGNLDSARAVEILTLLREMVNSEGLTLLLVTHDTELAARFADRLIKMRDGKVIEEN